MPLETGLVLTGYHSLRKICAPLSNELAPCFWVIDTQSFPLTSLVLDPSPENEAIVDRLFWKVPALVNTSTCGFRPGLLPQFADDVLVDEQSYYFAIASDGDEALRRATLLADHIGDCSLPFLQRLDDFADLFLYHGDGWWEFFTGPADWHPLLRSHWWPNCRERSLSQAGKPP
jgi:hypothetical protein